MEAIQRPITYKVEQFNGKNTEAIEKLLEGTRVQFIGSGRTRLQWPGTGFYENGPDIRVWEDDWVVVSSTGEIRKLTPEQYTDEFYEEWETPDTVEDKIAFLAKYLYRLANNDAFTVDTGDWNKLDLLARGDR